MPFIKRNFIETSLFSSVYMTIFIASEIQFWHKTEGGVRWGWSSLTMQNLANLIRDPFIHCNLLNHYKNSSVTTHPTYTPIPHIHREPTKINIGRQISQYIKMPSCFLFFLFTYKNSWRYMTWNEWGGNEPNKGLK